VPTSGQSGLNHPTDRARLSRTVSSSDDPRDRGVYFAYGSNMSSTRILERLPNARAMGAASWPGMRLTCNQLSIDGSGKANLVADEGHRAWGVLYEIEERDWVVLDKFEARYVRRRCSVNLDGGAIRAAQVYLGNGPFCEIPPFDWYRDHLLEGAREFELPRSIIELILSFDTI
jgi:gamma-glutamylcyclotransferase